MSEYWDIYDKNRKLTGKIVERGKPMTQDEYHLVVEVVIINSKGEYLISKRTPNKHLPLMWEFTGGSVISGENSISGAVREAKEELGIDLDKNKATLFKSGIRQYRSFPDFNDIWVFEFECDIDDIVLNENETCDAKWATAETIKEMIENGEFVEYNELPFVDELFEHYSKR